MLLGLKAHNYVRSDLKIEFMSLKTLNKDSIANTAYAYNLYQILHTWMIMNGMKRESSMVELNSTIYATFKIRGNLETRYYVMLSCLVLTTVIYAYYVISKLLMYTKHYNHRRYLVG